jgi:hypothetical protein
MKSCPSCKSIQTERIRRKEFQRLLSKFGFNPFVCNECGRRFYAKDSTPPNPTNHTQPRHP